MKSVGDRRRRWLRLHAGLYVLVGVLFTGVWWLAERSFGKGAESGDPDLYIESAERDVEKMFSGGKAHLRPIYDALYDFMEGKTVIAIAHRLSTIARMDRIVVLDRGRIAEEGRHQDLLARAGIYHRLWSRQSGGFLGVDSGD